MEQLLKKLSGYSAVSSREEQLRAVLEAEAAPFADSLRTDAMGNLIVFKKGTVTGEKRLLVDVHMDECGVMVCGFTEEGCLRFQTVGPVDRRTLIGKRVWMGEKELPGVIGMKPIHLSSKEERKKVPDTDDLYIDIGAKDKKAAEALLELGDVGHFACGGVRFGKNNWKGKILDSAIPCAVALTLLKEPLPMDCTFVFGAQEQVGTRGAYAAAYAERPDVVLCLDGVAADDGPGQPKEKRTRTVGSGVVLPVSDRFCIYDRSLFEELRSLAEGENIPWQVAAAVPGSANGGAYQRSRGGIRTVGMAVPVRYLHAPTQVASLADAEAMLRLTRAFLTAQAEEETR